MSTLDVQIEELTKKLHASQKKIEQESLFAERANLTFENNMQAFKEYFPDIYERFVSHSPQDKFRLIVNENGSGNLIDYETSVPIYSEDPVEQINKQVEASLAHPELSRVNHANIEFLDNEAEFLHVDLMCNIGAVYNEARNALEFNNKVDKHIPSLVIFGIGLGYHLQKLIDATTASYISIFEPNEDYFFASLFVFDWKHFLETVDKQDGALYFGIGVSEDKLYETLYKRVQHLGAYSIAHSYFYQHYPSKKVNDLIAQIRANFHQFFMGWGFCDDAFMSIAHTVKNAENNVSLTVSKPSLSKNTADFPIFIVANGPSLDNDIEAIKQYQGNVIVVACNSAATALLKHGITPDFHVALERTKETYDFLRHILTDEQLKNINLLTLNVMYPEVMGLFGWAGVGLKGSESGTSLLHVGEFIKNKTITTTLGYSNPLVGNTALSFFATMGFKQIYLFGFDNGYIDPEHHHSKSSFYYNKSGEEVHKPIKIGGEFSVKGNFVESVKTDSFMFTGKEQMERLFTSFKHTQLYCFNCSNGAYIEGTTPLHSGDILLSDLGKKQDIIETIKTTCFAPIDPELNLTSYLDFDVFENICSVMVEFLEKPMGNRSEALSNLLESLRYLFSFKMEGRYLHLYFILEGEALYTSSVLLSTLYNFGNEEEIIPYYEKALAYWITFLKDAPEYYRERWDRLSDHTIDLSSVEV